jgi:transposase
MSDRAIARSLGLSKGSVNNYVGRARRAGLEWPLPEGLDDDSLELLLFPDLKSLPTPERPVPDWSLVDREMRKRNVTRALLWQEYREQHPGGFGYSWLSNRAPPVKPAGKSLAASPLTGRTRPSSDAFHSR